MSLLLKTPPTHVSNADKQGIMPENAHKDNNTQGITGRTKWPTLLISRTPTQMLTTPQASKMIRKPSNHYKPD